MARSVAGRVTVSVGSLEDWIEAQYRRAAAGLLRSVSPVTLVKARPGFGQVVRPLPGAVVASPVLADYDPEPDYFFHWYRDSALVIDALRLLCRDPTSGTGTAAHFADFVRFSTGLQRLDGRRLLQASGWRAVVAPGFAQYVRADEELARIHGATVAADTRVNADGTLDLACWARPQHDGPALRALTLLRWLAAVPLAPEIATLASGLLRSDLDFVREHWSAPCFDIWEEEFGYHYYTLRVSEAALAQGADWLARHQQPGLAETLREQARSIAQRLEGYWVASEGSYRSRELPAGRVSDKQLDIAVVLAAVHATDPADPARSAPTCHSCRDPRTHATLGRLESLFDRLYPINRDRPTARAPALGRYAGDHYYSGGAYYFSTLGAAELCFAAAASLSTPGQQAGLRDGEGPCGEAVGTADALLQRGDAYLRTVREFIPASGAMSEQFDQRSGAPSSARDLAWSYAAFISCVSARRAALTARVAGALRPADAPHGASDQR